MLCGAVVPQGILFVVGFGWVFIELILIKKPGWSVSIKDAKELLFRMARVAIIKLGRGWCEVLV